MNLGPFYSFTQESLGQTTGLIHLPILFSSIFPYAIRPPKETPRIPRNSFAIALAHRHENLAWRHKPIYTAVYSMLKTNPAQRAAFMGRICFSKWDLFKRKLNGYKELTLTITRKMNPVFTAGFGTRYNPEKQIFSRGSWQQMTCPAEQPMGEQLGENRDSAKDWT